MGADERDNEKLAGKIDRKIATLRAQSGKMVGGSKRRREVLAEHYRELETPKTNKKVNKELERRAGEHVEASKREDGGSQEFTRDEVRKCVTELDNRDAAGVDEIVKESLKHEGEETTTMLITRCDWILEEEHTPKRLREGVAIYLFMKGDKADRERVIEGQRY